MEAALVAAGAPPSTADVPAGLAAEQARPIVAWRSQSALANGILWFAVYLCICSVRFISV
jgi:hypothetical protein